MPTLLLLRDDSNADSAKQCVSIEPIMPCESCADTANSKPVRGTITERALKRAALSVSIFLPSTHKKAGTRQKGYPLLSLTQAASREKPDIFI
jgi:hypothetical protein